MKRTANKTTSREICSARSLNTLGYVHPLAVDGYLDYYEGMSRTECKTLLASSARYQASAGVNAQVLASTLALLGDY